MQLNTLANVEILIPITFQYISQKYLNDANIDEGTITGIYESLTQISGIEQFSGSDEIKEFLKMSLCEEMIIKFNSTVREFYTEKCPELLGGIVNLGFIRIASRVKQIY